MQNYDCERLILGYLIDNQYKHSAACILRESSTLKDFGNLRRRGKKLQLKLFGLNLPDILEDFFSCKDLVSEWIENFPETFYCVPKIASLGSQLEAIYKLGWQAELQNRQNLESHSESNEGEFNKLPFAKVTPCTLSPVEIITDPSDVSEGFNDLDNGQMLSTLLSSTSSHGHSLSTQTSVSNESSYFLLNATKNVNEQQDHTSDVLKSPVIRNDVMFNHDSEDIPHNNAAKPMGSSRKRNICSPWSESKKRNTKICNRVNVSSSGPNSTFDEEMTVLEDNDHESLNILKTHLSHENPTLNLRPEREIIEKVVLPQVTTIAECHNINVGGLAPEQISLPLEGGFVNTSPTNYDLACVPDNTRKVCTSNAASSSESHGNSLCTIASLGLESVLDITPANLSHASVCNTITEANKIDMSPIVDTIPDHSPSQNVQSFSSENLSTITSATGEHGDNSVSESLGERINKNDDTPVADPSNSQGSELEKVMPVFLAGTSPYSPLKHLQTKNMPMKSPSITNSEYLSGTPDHTSNFTITKSTPLEEHGTFKQCNLNQRSELQEDITFNLGAVVVMETEEPPVENISKKRSSSRVAGPNDATNGVNDFDNDQSPNTPHQSTSSREYSLASQNSFSNKSNHFLKNAALDESVDADSHRSHNEYDIVNEAVQNSVNEQQEHATAIRNSPILNDMLNTTNEEILQTDTAEPRRSNRIRNKTYHLSLPRKRKKKAFNSPNASFSGLNKTFNEDVIPMEDKTHEALNMLKTQVSKQNPKQNMSPDGDAIEEDVLQPQTTTISDSTTGGTYILPLPLPSSDQNLCSDMTQYQDQTSNVLSHCKENDTSRDYVNKSVSLLDNKNVNISTKRYTHYNVTDETPIENTSLPVQGDIVNQCPNKDNSECASENIQNTCQINSFNNNESHNSSLSDTSSLSCFLPDITSENISFTSVRNIINETNEKDMSPHVDIIPVHSHSQNVQSLSSGSHSTAITSATVVNDDTFIPPYSPLKQLQTKVMPVKSPSITNSEYLSGTPDHATNYTLTELTPLEEHDVVQQCNLNQRTEHENKENVALDLGTVSMPEPPSVENIRKKTSSDGTADPNGKPTNSKKTNIPMITKGIEKKKITIQRNMKKNFSQLLRMANYKAKHRPRRSDTVKSNMKKGANIRNKPSTTKEELFETSKSTSNPDDDEELSERMKLALDSFRVNPVGLSSSIQVQNQVIEQESTSFTEGVLESLIDQVATNSSSKEKQKFENARVSEHSDCSPAESAYSSAGEGNSLALSHLLSYCENETLYSQPLNCRRKISSSAHIIPKVSQVYSRLCKSTPRYKSRATVLDSYAPDKKCIEINPLNVEANEKDAMNKLKARNNLHSCKTNFSNVREPLCEYENTDNITMSISENENTSDLPETADSHPEVTALDLSTNYCLFDDSMGRTGSSEKIPNIQPSSTVPNNHLFSVEKPANPKYASGSYSAPCEDTRYQPPKHSPLQDNLEDVLIKVAQATDDLVICNTRLSSCQKSGLQKTISGSETNEISDDLILEEVELEVICPLKKKRGRKRKTKPLQETKPANIKCPKSRLTTIEEKSPEMKRSRKRLWSVLSDKDTNNSVETVHENIPKAKRSRIKSRSNSSEKKKKKSRKTSLSKVQAKDMKLKARNVPLLLNPYVRLNRRTVNDFLSRPLSNVANALSDENSSTDNIESPVNTRIASDLFNELERQVAILDGSFSDFTPSETRANNKLNSPPVLRRRDNNPCYVTNSSDNLEELISDDSTSCDMLSEADNSFDCKSIQNTPTTAMQDVCQSVVAITTKSKNDALEICSTDSEEEDCFSLSMSHQINLFSMNL